MTDNDDGQNHGGGNPPKFSGNMRDYEEWKFDVENWKFNTKVTKDKQASRLYGAQTEKREVPHERSAARCPPF